jgi:hypothetical protein
MSIADISSANYPDHLNGDRNYIMVDGHMGTAWYVDRSSLNVQKYAPPEYIIAVNVVSARSVIDDEQDFYSGGQGKITGVKTHRFYYNWNTKRMYYDNNGKWVYLDPWGGWAHTGIRMPAGEMAFYLAYSMKFYGTMEKYSKYYNEYYACFPDAFYSRAR